ncbi:MAG TPA: hypothetical protein DCQ26_00820 [Marinilabiliales bacterium]|jgi:hypothetical protein|nr:MAG: hypothetical protein A2W95_17470 [Bacteroidetes bacterium GWA2_40_14]OFX56996.1 MAG: hypothetical protein A2W84_11810 [Bacteroidetes bacterium GWC2_40_13]OFX74869.1 MAG: hypothetical protein A2W96_01955 [Bacteroidetes bacterium GWD2_40_43]OFX93412.1 MAG: hypothetical protein A2W97_15285 [Bacteroidetes bacterium GWE2_40_63]OFY18425.1 MAG: hypothetical protein A2W88_19205 [Bacteroidetes bacterium GWF2_40_13]OFZ26448.1 MAG: hypothetical protein A2437_08105 [Bacteroidetes bacterium RIFOXYC
MKKLYLLTLALGIVFNLIAQETSDAAIEKNVIKVNTISIIVGTGSIFYERQINDLNSVQMGVAYLSYSIKGTKFTGLILTPEYRFYPKSNAIDGIYLAPYLRFQRYSIDDDGDGGNYTSLGGGAVFGKQWITKSGFAMDLFFGGTYSKGDVSVNSAGEEYDVTQFEGFRPRVGFAIGIAF